MNINNVIHTVSVLLLSYFILAKLPTITISAESLRISVLHYARTLKTSINLPIPVIVPYGTVLSLYHTSCMLLFQGVFPGCLLLIPHQPSLKSTVSDCRLDFGLISSRKRVMINYRYLSSDSFWSEIYQNILL